MTRDEAIREFVRVTGYTGAIPDADAPLPDALAFVGRIAEALGDEWLLTVQQDSNQRCVGFHQRHDPTSRKCGVDYQDDPSHAAMLAAAEAKE